MAERDQDAVVGQSGGELPGAVDWIDHPDPFGVEIARPELLAENAVPRIGRVNPLAQHLLDHQVDRGHR